jgi:hypothetical protein
MRMTMAFNIRLDPELYTEMKNKAVKLGYWSFTEFIRESMKLNHTRREVVCDNIIPVQQVQDSGNS